MTKSTDQHDLPALQRELLGSDAAYFRAAAECAETPGFHVYHMPGLESLAAGCVAFRIACGGEAFDPGWLPLLEQKFIALDCHHSRIYQPGADGQMETLLKQNGYRPAIEIALLHTYGHFGSTGAETAGAVLEAVNSEQAWSAKLDLHRQVARGPDGHVSSAEEWVEMERKKSSAGYMEPFLIVLGDTVCGAVNFAPMSRIGRLKNIVISPRWRRRGIGVQGASLIARLAQKRGKKAAGCFAMKNGNAVKMYQNAGYFPVTQQTEWYKSLK